MSSATYMDAHTLRNIDLKSDYWKFGLDIISIKLPKTGVVSAISNIEYTGHVYCSLVPHLLWKINNKHIGLFYCLPAHAKTPGLCTEPPKTLSLSWVLGTGCLPMPESFLGSGPHQPATNTFSSSSL